MSPEERQLLAGLFDRTRGAVGNPRDAEAETFISDAVRAQPYAPYLLAQTVLVQEQALRAANDRLQELEAKVHDLESQAAKQPAGSGSFLSGLGSLFGGGNPPPPQRDPVPPPSNAPQNPWQRSQQPQPGAWQQPPQQGYNQPYAAPQPGPWGGAPAGGQGGGFLKGALGAAAGVAGGVLLADSIRGLFGGHNNPLGIGTGFGGGAGGLGAGTGGETIVNNYYGTDDQSLARQDAQQDADQDQDDIQDAADYDDQDYGNDDDGSYDV